VLRSNKAGFFLYQGMERKVWLALLHSFGCPAVVG
jgi:hypothetical protein